MDFSAAAKKVKTAFDEDPDLIIETDIENGRLIICRTGVDDDEYRLSLEKQIEVEDEDGNEDEECEQLLEDGSDLRCVESIVQAYLDEGGDASTLP